MIQESHAAPADTCPKRFTITPEDAIDSVPGTLSRAVEAMLSIYGARVVSVTVEVAS